MSATPAFCTVSIPGPRGVAGLDGDDGADGANAFTTIQEVSGLPVAIPAYAANATIYVGSSAWAVPTQVIYIQFAGYYRVDSIVDNTHLSVTNLGYTGNVNAVGNFTNLARVGPAGLVGATGAAGADGTSITFPTTTKGDIIADNGALSPNPSVVRVAAGTNGQVPAYDSVQASGVIATTIAPNTATDNGIARFNGTTGKPVPVQDSAMTVSDSGDLQISTGDAKGTNAVDLQTQRTNVNRVASGTRAVVAGGRDNQATAQDSAVLGGYDNHATAQGAACGGGEGNAVAGQDACVPGGSGNGANGAYSRAGGLFALTSSHGQDAWAAGRFTVTGDAEKVDNLMRNVTANATPTELFMDGAATRLVIGGSYTWGLRGTILAEQDDGTSSYWTFEGAIKRWPGTALLAAITPTMVCQDAGAAAWTVAVTADAGNNSLKIEVVGAVASNIRWQAHVLLNAIGWQ